MDMYINGGLIKSEPKWPKYRVYTSVLGAIKDN